jgi:gluconolactonase
LLRRTLLKSLAASMSFPAIASESRSAGLRIESHDPRLARYLAPGAPIDVLGEGLRWAEGPTWDARRGCLYFSDIPANRIHRWSQGRGVELWRSPAGSGQAPRGVMPGTNGLYYVARDDSLLICDQDSRSILKYRFADGQTEPWITSGTAGAFNSPNDLAFAPDGTAYFTDPTAGLTEGDSSSLRERHFAGVYRRGLAGEVEVLDSSLSFPNGIAVSPDGQFLYVSVSDKAAPRIVRYDLGRRGMLRGELFFDMRSLQADGSPGMPDGIAVARDGTLFATAPGGVAILSSRGELFGRIATGAPTGNCCFDSRGRYLFVTANDRLLRVALRG